MVLLLADSYFCTRMSEMRYVQLFNFSLILLLRIVLICTGLSVESFFYFMAGVLALTHAYVP